MFKQRHIFDYIDDENYKVLTLKNIQLFHPQFKNIN